MYKGPSAGRFDFGPIRVMPKHDNLWWGKRETEITGAYSAKKTSIVDSATGVQLIREFTLSAEGSKLICTQTIINKSNTNKRYCFWGRTFVNGGGKCFVPLSPNSRYPKQYISYENKKLLFEPEVEDNVSITDNIFVMNKFSKYKKYVMDGEGGWMAYLSKNNLLFVKKFIVYPEKKYAEMTACTMSVWFNEDEIVEIEPMGPWEWIEPGKSTSFTEEWYLQVVDYAINANQIESIVDTIK